MTQPLYVALLWHMHQPYYLDQERGHLSLPWVRLHGTKDYLHMLEVLQDYPDVHVTFNVVPSLTEQLDLYARGQTEDKALQISRQTSWSVEERQFMLSLFFHISWNKVIRTYPRYWRLLQMRQAAPDCPGLFSEQYFRDLIAWFNLAWIDPIWLEQDGDLTGLVSKGCGFDSQDITLILDKQMQIIQRILPAYNAMQDSGQIEITTSPYYHPILPLLIATHVARRASPDLPLPSPAFAHPEDARVQIRRAVQSHTHYYGRRPAGIWPSEGAVCEEMIQLLAESGFRWLATDESVLAKSLNVAIERDEYGHVLNPEVLYQPYRASSDPDAPTVVFRDNVLSDRIGFVYQHMESKDAVNDLMHRLYVIRDRLVANGEPYLVAIILDGENCWEEYEKNGDVFLHRLYERLSREKEYLCAVTVSEYLNQYPARERLEKLATGSWIGGNLETWIGEPAQNLAWEYLAKTRQRLVAWENENPTSDPGGLNDAWEALYVAEGSDWFWWYYSRNNPESENLFDIDFRRHLMQVYSTIGLPIPQWLNVPIEVDPGARQRQRRPAGKVDPPLTAAESLPAGWEEAGYIDAAPAGGVMQRADTVMQRVYYGPGQADLYIRCEMAQDLQEDMVSIYLSRLDRQREKSDANHQPRHHDSNPALRYPELALEMEVRLSECEAAVYRSIGSEKWDQSHALSDTIIGARVLEAKIPYSMLGITPGDNLGFYLVLYRAERVLETVPVSGYIKLEIPI